MAIIKTGTLTVAATNTAQNLVIGFVPDYFYMVNTTNVATPVNDELVKVEWFSSMANATAIATNYTGSQPAIEINNVSSNGITPYRLLDDQLYIPDQAPYNDSSRVPMMRSTNLRVTNISKASQAVVTATHSFTDADIGVTWVTFSQVQGMTQINTLRGLVVDYTSTTSFVVDIDSSSFSTYEAASIGIANVITGAPATRQIGAQILQTQNYNRGVIGLTLGSNVIAAQDDIWRWYAFIDAGEST